MTVDSLLKLCNYADSTCQNLYSQLFTYLDPLRNDPVLPLLTFKEPHCLLEELFVVAEREKRPETTACLLHAILLAKVESPFYKFNIHAAMTPSEVKKLFEPVFTQAKDLHNIYQQKAQHNKTVPTASQSSTPRASSSFFSTTTSSDITPFVTVRT